MKIDKIIAFENMANTYIEVIFEHNNKEYIYNFLTKTFAEQDFEDEDFDREEFHKELREALEALKSHEKYTDLAKLQEMHVMVDVFGESSEQFFDELNELEDSLVDDRILL